MTAGRLAVFTIAWMVAAGCGWEQNRGPRSQTYGGDEAADPVVVDGQPVVVDRVVDGDSIELTVEGAEVELRLEGYNAPELYAERDGVDTKTCNGEAAKEATIAVIGQSASIELLATGDDRFGRTLGDLLVDGRSLVDRLVADGHGLATGDDFRRREAMMQAAAVGVGVWGDGCGRPRSDRVGIGEVQVDAPGNDRNNLIEEYVQVVNLGPDEVELDGWVLRDDTTGHRFELSGRLGPEARLTVVTGGERTDSDVSGSGTLYLEESFPVWSNDWETVVLVDPDGVFADWRFVTDGEVLLD